MSSESHRPGRHGNETMEERQDKFLSAIVDSVTDKDACVLAGISSTTLYNWIRDDTLGFNARLAEAEAPRGRNLEQRMFAVLNWATADEEKYDKLLRYPNLFMFALRGLMPQKYGLKIGLGQDEAKKIVDELLHMRDDPLVRVKDGGKLEDDLDVLLGPR